MDLLTLNTVSALIIQSFYLKYIGDAHVIGETGQGSLSLCVCVGCVKAQGFQDCVYVLKQN